MPGGSLMKGFKRRSIFGLFLMIVLWAVIFVASSFAGAIPDMVPKTWDPDQKVDQHGDVIVVVGESSFSQTGGDPATHFSGSPFTNHTVFEGLSWVNHQRHAVPNVAY